MRVKTKGLENIKKKFIARANKLNAIINAELQSFGKETEDKIKKVINKNIHRKPSSGNLARNMNYHKLVNGWGVGHIPTLDSEAAYWQMVDKGGFLPGGGRLVPTMYTDGLPDPAQKGIGRHRATELKVVNNANLSLARPLNYIDETYHWFYSKAKGFFSRLKGV